ncbi:16S rRNA (cytosine(1402)-N(4))-methyltransferase [Candidatus Peregrinibacteria bacterium CG10_big_fil_rev_8_21_14_0_10_42_8]|nr:MAG: 16S rRNA (cytosine(1402)-N(4))-methyltransferase [Candidatus Peregrinibacteria bacterium CG10_big_fil_rev_8_21_14_0_10_42_8]
MTNFDPNHRPVLINETLEFLAPKTGESVLDVTLGLAGHSRAFLEKIGTGGALTGLDADNDNVQTAQENLEEFAENTTFIHTNFERLEELDIGTFDIIFADLGLSSPHLDNPEKGFSIRADGPLDMRFDRTAGPTAADWISSSTEEELADIFYRYGEIRQSRKLAAVLKTDKPKTTFGLNASCEHVFHHKNASFLPQVFQSLRIAVNNELHALEVLLRRGPEILHSGGRIGIISFHSLEDRMVKQTFKALATPEIDDRTGAVSKEAGFELITRKAIKPSEEEVEANQRSRSAILRVLRKK